jgi:hypothetical protein
MALDETVLAGQTGHIADHNAIHAEVGQGLPTGLSSLSYGATHTGWHQTIHTWLNSFRPLVYPGPPALPSNFVTVTSTGANPGAIQNAINANPNGTAIRLSGNWTGANRITSQIEPKQGNVLFAASKGGAVLEGAAALDAVIWCQGVTDVRIENLEVFGTQSNGIRVATRGVVRGCDVHSCLSTGIGSVQASDFRIEDCDVHDNGDATELGNNASGMKIVRTGNNFDNNNLAHGCTIRFNRVANNTGNGIWLDIDNGNASKDSLTSKSPNTTINPNLKPIRVYGNTVTDNSRRGIFWEISRGPAYYRWNNVQGNASDVTGAAGLSTVASLNLWMEWNQALNNVNGNARVANDNRDTPVWIPGEYHCDESIVYRRNWIGGQNVEISTSGGAPMPTPTIGSNPQTLATSGLSSGHLAHHNLVHAWANSRELAT